MPREEIAGHYARAHVFVLPSYNEGMSVATLEAMAAGLPLVVTRTGGTAELVEEGVNGYTSNWADIDALTDYLRTFGQDRALAQHMGAASRARALNFSWEISARRYLDIFEELTSTLLPRSSLNCSNTPNCTLSSSDGNRLV